MTQTTVKIGDRLVGDGQPPYVIVEACVNHQGDFAIAQRMVHYAHAMGADAIKFQMHILEDEMLREVPMSDNFELSLWDTIAQTNFSTEQHRQLMTLCAQLGIRYLCTPFSRAAADVLDELGVVAFKTGSGELTNIPFMRHLAAKGKPVIVSTGMSLLDEIAETVAVFREANVPLVLTHCVSAYPCPYERVNLGMVPRLRELFGVPVGLSCHTPTIYTALGAVALGAAVIEKHFTFDRAQSGPDHKSSIEGAELGEMVKGCRAVFLAGGARREIFPEERQIVAWARESVVSLADIPAGTVLTDKMVSVKRPTPGEGAIAARDLERVIGRTTARAITGDRQLLWADLA
ncbi:MAG: N-acetylneuraminate synthase family protein [Magnetospirillum sp.]|nr:N-acetylneuraminate synthase family protein [Magnetospirillum sp.]